jgi:hypothetical protein
MAKKTHDDERETSEWEPEPFPGAGSPEQLKAAFKVVNDWAHFLQDWDNRVRAMCLILQARCDLTNEQFESVVASVKGKNHSPDRIRTVLNLQGSKAANFGGAADVVGHPPDPPFDPIT